MNFSPSEKYVSGSLSIPHASPFTTCDGLVRATIQSKLAQADTDPQMEGWRANDVKARLDEFVTEGLHVAMENI